MSSPSWFILGSVPRVSDGDDDELEEEVSVALVAPPRVSTVTVPRRIAPDPITPDNFPAFRAADPSAGLLLLASSQGSLAAAGRAAPNELGLPAFVDPDVMLPAYFVCDLATATAFGLPEPHATVSCHRSLAITATPGGHYMVAHLHTIGHAPDHASLLCFWSDTQDWEEKKDLPLLHHRNNSFDPDKNCFDSAVTLDGRLWWVDLHRGLLTCDPFADHPVLRFVPLPKGMSSLPCSHHVHKFRCVSISAGKLRFLELNCRTAKVTMWTLNCPAHQEEEEVEWVMEYQLSLQHLLADDSYKAAGLKEDSQPVLAFVHPTNPDVVYFFIGENLVGVHMRAIKVIDWDVCHLVLPPIEFVSSGFVIACQLPPSISERQTLGLPGKDTDTAVAEESTSQPSLLLAYANK